MSGQAEVASTRFETSVSGVGTGPGHHFVIGDGLYLVFRDKRAARTNYRVCWGPRRGGFTRCWRRRSGYAGTYSKIIVAAPSYVGHWTAKWFAFGRTVGTWRFYNGPGD
jgi:hypothetical protein